MKNLKLSSLLAMLVCAFVFTSCSDDDDNVGSAEDLIGTWQSVQEIYWRKDDGVLTKGDTEWHEYTDERYEFTADGKMNFYNSNWILVYTTDYTYSGGKLIYENGEEMYKVVVLNSTTLELEFSDYNEDKGIERYERIQYRRV